MYLKEKNRFSSFEEQIQGKCGFFKRDTYLISYVVSAMILITYQTQQKRRQSSRFVRRFCFVIQKLCPNDFWGICYIPSILPRQKKTLSANLPFTIPTNWSSVSTRFAPAALSTNTLMIYVFVYDRKESRFKEFHSPKLNA